MAYGAPPKKVGSQEELMNLELIGKDVEPSAMLKGRIETKLNKLERRLGQNLFVRVKLESEPNNHFSCSIHFQGPGHEYNANSTSDDLIKAADEALQKVERQVSKAQHRPASNRKESASIRHAMLHL